MLCFYLFTSLFSCPFLLGALQETRALNREALYAASKDIEAAGKQRGKPPSAAKKTKKKEKELPPVDVEEAGKVKANKKRKHEPTPAKPAAPAAASVPPSTEKPKAKKAKVKAAEPETQAPAEVPAPASDPKSNKKKLKKQLRAVAAANGSAGDVTPVGSLANGAGQEEKSHRKSVRFRLKRNLVMTIGQPPLPEDVRTPPTSKPKGSALKVKGPGVTRASLLGKTLSSRLAAVSGPSSVPPKPVAGNLHRGKGKTPPMGSQSASKAQGRGNNAPRTLPSPASARRPRAAEFF